MIKSSNFTTETRFKPEKFIKDNTGISVGFRDTYLKFGTHWHDYFEIEFFLSGNGQNVINGKVHNLSEFNCYLLTPFDYHSLELSPEYKGINLSFIESAADEKILKIIFSPKFKKAYYLEENELYTLVKLCDLLKSESFKDSKCKNHIVNCILEYLISKNTDLDLACTTEQYENILRTVSYMYLHYKENITLKTLADVAGYNSSYFSKIFSKVTGETYIEKLNSLRVKSAQKMLANGCSVSESAYSSGFNSLSNFLTIFKNYTNLTPTEYKIQYHHNKK